MKKTYRIKKEREFQQVFQEGTSFANRKFVVYCLPPSEQKHFRVGISVGKKVGNAVTRNRVKRLIRAVLKDVKPQIDPSLDFIVIARPTTGELSYAEVRSNLTHVLKLAKIMS